MLATGVATDIFYSLLFLMLCSLLDAHLSSSLLPPPPPLSLSLSISLSLSLSCSHKHTPHVYGETHTDSNQSRPELNRASHLCQCLSIYKDLTCIFRASCYSAHLSWVLVLTWISPFVQDKKLGLGWGKVILLPHSR